jgi:hypothetical protein
MRDRQSGHPAGAKPKVRATEAESLLTSCPAYGKTWPPCAAMSTWAWGHHHFEHKCLCVPTFCRGLGTQGFPESCDMDWGSGDEAPFLHAFNPATPSARDTVPSLSCHRRHFWKNSMTPQME